MCNKTPNIFSIVCMPVTALISGWGRNYYIFSMCRYAQSCAFISVIELPRIPAYYPKIYITKKRTVSWLFDTRHFRILPAHLSMTAFANSHLKVLKQCNAVIISAVRICGNLLSQICQEAVSFSVQMSFKSILYAFSSAVYMYPVLVWHGIIFVVPPRPGGIAAACGRDPIRRSRLRKTMK